MAELSTDCQQTVDNFHKVYYENESLWFKDTMWMGVPIRKLPSDMMIYQEIIYRTRPDVIIETGTAVGGSALFFASLFDLMGNGLVLTIDVEKHGEPPRHGRIRYFNGSSADTSVADEVKDFIPAGAAVMVVLDSCHEKGHVMAEMELYGPLVAPGCYMVVEDTNINGNPVFPDFGLGPKEAVDEFLPNHPEFSANADVEKYMFTFHPGGFLRKTQCD